MKNLISYFIVLLSIIFIAGCGSNTFTAVNTNTVSSDGMASLDITADWPDGKDLSAQLIPDSAVKIEVKVQTTGNFLLKQAEIVRPENKVSITGLPVNQKLQIIFRALDASNNIVSHRISIRTLKEGLNTTSVQLGVTIRGRTLLPANLNVSPGDNIMWSNRDSSYAYIISIEDPNGTVELSVPSFDLNNPNNASVRYTVPAGAVNDINYTLYDGITSVATGKLVLDWPHITSVTNTDTGGSLAKDGDTLTVVGTNFGTSQGTVSINGTNAGVTSWTETSITCTVAAGSFKTNGPIVPFSVIRSDGQSAGFDKMVLYSYNTSDTQTMSNNISPIDVAFDSTGNNFYISDSAWKVVRRYNFNTRTLDYTSANIPCYPSFIDFCNTNSSVYGSVGSRIYKFSSDLSSYTTFGLGTYGASDGVSWNSVLGTILIVDFNASGSKIYSNSLDGATITTFLDEEALEHAAGAMTTDVNGNVYTGSIADETIKKFNSSGIFQYQISQRSSYGITSISSGSDTILAISSDNDLGQICIALHLCTNSSHTKLGEIVLTGYDTHGLDYSNHNLLLGSINPKAILLIKL